MKFLSFHKFRRSTLAIIFVLLMMLLFMLFSNYGLIKRLNLSNRKYILIEKIIHEKAVEDSLKNEIKLLENDKTAIEKLAREKYGMIRPGEKVFIFRDNNAEKK